MACMWCGWLHDGKQAIEGPASATTLSGVAFLLQSIQISPKSLPSRLMLWPNSRQFCIQTRWENAAKDWVDYRDLPLSR